MKTDNNGVSTCPKGKESFESFKTNGRQTFIQYDYRATDGALFSTVAPTLEKCRERCEAWKRDQQHE